jgi:hypothetical protein
VQYCFQLWLQEEEEAWGKSDTVYCCDIPRQCFLVFIIQAGWWQGKVLESEEDNEEGSVGVSRELLEPSEPI